MFPTALSDHRKGLLLTTIGGLALSMDIPLVRLAHGDMWSILGARSIATVAVLKTASRKVSVEQP